MGLQFRKRIKLFKGTYLNVGGKSVGISTGVKGVRVSTNTKTGSRVTVSAPGTGLSYQQKIGGKSKQRQKQAPAVQTLPAYAPFAGYVLPCHACGLKMDLSGLTDPRAHIMCPACNAATLLPPQFVAQVLGAPGAGAPMAPAQPRFQQPPQPQAASYPVAPHLQGGPYTPGGSPPAQESAFEPLLEMLQAVPLYLWCLAGGLIVYTVGWFALGATAASPAVKVVGIAAPLAVVAGVVLYNVFQDTDGALKNEKYRACPSCAVMNPAVYTACAKCDCLME